MTRQNTIITITAVAIVLIGAGLAYYVAQQDDASVARTTSKSPTAQDDYSDGAERESSSSNGGSQGGAADTRGADAPVTQIGITSESGLITVTEPTKDGLLKNDSIIGGAAKSGIDKVQYRLIDGQVGVLAQGSLSVVDGAFSGKLQFTPRSDSGRLDIFSFDQTGSEVNSVEISVKLGG